MPLDPYFAAKVDLIEGLDFSDLADPEKAGRVVEFSSEDGSWEEPGRVTIDTVTLPSGDLNVTVRTYRPAGRLTGGLLWMHGGGFTSGDINMPEAHVVAAELADRGSVMVVSVDYRLAGDGIVYPAPVDDVVTGWQYLIEQVGDDLPLAIGGASAGAALALSGALRVKDETGRAADALLLAYPFVHFPVPAPSAELTEMMAGLPPLVRFSEPAIAGMVQSYVGRLTDIPPAALPGAATLDGLPPTTIVLSEYDDLRPSGERLHQQLVDAGVPVSTYLSRGMLHGHLNRFPSLPEVEESLNTLARGVRPSAPR
ncbi:MULTISPECIES: alpha/beta hydrolase fold domain-containing protein [unclassified Microbacterium]|uniref:alpha/beta hydrolase fold domain-containing protein n=1 Tax=unclassified Microbacterium TaxID=2609290 RepID=UPI000EAA6D87|nr:MULTISPECIES: alpha/beta hydrolase fold domain-containing protein [unclassified Microbacterium]MBT2486504.1 alpha/beta hydrolase fold domain-containing protein [Microbacterium sp. ISL-108]RKN69200.1 alpha/beta hydrolase [Microbacterium sp. CGR2]